MSAVPDIRAGVDNLLFNCMEAERGDTLAIIAENSDDYFSPSLAENISTLSRSYSIDTRIVSTNFVEEATILPGEISEVLDDFDHILFLARIGDQVRFTELVGRSSKTMCYAQDEQSFATAFCSADHRFFVAFKGMVNAALFGERLITITCPAGTKLEGVSPRDPGDDDIGDVTVKRFPMNVFRPIPASTFSGVLALTKWLCLTGSRFYEPDHVTLDDVVFAKIENGRIVDFDGSRSEVKKVREHYDRVAERFGIDRDVIHSWHAGIHPQNGYFGRAIDNLARWSGSGFGNPRYLHFHTCGDYAPGEICISTFDPTVSVDGVDLWRNGNLLFAETPAALGLMAQYPGMQELFERPVREYGLGGAGCSA
jgi:hypothetical protein